MKTKLPLIFALGLLCAGAFAQTPYANCPLDANVTDANKKINFTASSSGLSFVTDDSRSSVAEFDGTNGYISADPAKIYNFDAVSFNLWFKWTTSVKLQWWARLWDFGWNNTLNPNGLNHDVNFCTLFQDGLLKWHIHPRKWTNGSDTVLASKDTIKLNQWYMITVTHASDSAKLYLNGILNDKRATGVAPKAFDSIVTAYFGKSNWPDPLFTGHMDNLSVYNAALTQSQVTTLYNAQAVGIRSIAINSDVSVYSAESRIYVKLVSGLKANVAVFDITGRLVQLKNTYNISDQQFRSGLYLIRVTGDGVNYSTKLIVR